jgi:hypothetical protein
MSSTGSSYGYAKARTSTIDLLSVSSSEPDTSDGKTGGKDGLTPPLKSTGLETEEEEEEDDDHDDSGVFLWKWIRIRHIVLIVFEKLLT